MRVNELDHMVLTVLDIEATCAFYRRALGMETVTFGEGRKALQFGTQKINLHQVGQGVEPRARQPIPGSADLCFLTPTPLAQVIEHLGRVGVAIEKGPVDRAGAQGPIRSVYLRDPDGNLIEVSNRVVA